MFRLRTISFLFMMPNYLEVMKKIKCYPHALSGYFFFGKRKYIYIYCVCVCVCVCVLEGDLVFVCLFFVSFFVIFVCVFFGVVFLCVWFF